MYHNQAQITPSLDRDLLAAAEAAARAIPPAFPLEATVAVNPFLGQAGEDLAKASARLSRTAGVRAIRPRGDFAQMVREGTITLDDIASALAGASSPLKPASVPALTAALARQAPAGKPLATVADLAARMTGTDWPALITRSFGLWASGHFDRGQALWAPAKGRGAFVAWRAWATRDLTPEIAGLSGFCAHVAAAPDTAERALLRAAERLGIGPAAAETAFHRLLMDLGGWAQHGRFLLWEAELGGGTDDTLTDLLAIRLVWEEALLAHVPEAASEWSRAVDAHATPVAASEDDVVDAILQEAAERAHQRRLVSQMSGSTARTTRPVLQAAFCIDVRSEVFRRALESQGPAIETIGFAGFFGLPLAHRAHGTEELDAHLPVLLTPSVISSGHGDARSEDETRIAARTSRAWGRFRQAAVSSFAFVEAAGAVYGWKLVRDALALGDRSPAPVPAPHIEGGMSPEAKAATGAAVLKAMSMTEGHARLVLLLGHGAQVTNNPHESAYQCGACGGRTGEVSARVLATLLNDPETRAGLKGHGVEVAEDTVFLAGLHETITDTVRLYRDTPMPTHEAEIAEAQVWLAKAGMLSRSERALRIPGSVGESLAARATNWAEVRPEWALAGCAAFIAAPRSTTAGLDLGGRAFLHSYDWRADAGFGTLELILTAPVVVASWISLQYYGSCVAPEAFGGGDKLIHNVVGGMGVVQGNGGVLRAGLPWQAVHDGARLMHEPLRLTVMVEAPRKAMTDVLEKHDGVRALFDNGWLHLLALEEGRVAARYRPGLSWQSDAVEAVPA